MTCTLRISQLLHQQPVLCEIHGESFDETWEDDRSDLACRTGSRSAVVSVTIRESSVDHFNN